MVTPINLNRARKDRARAQRKRQADANAIRFGRTKTQREMDRVEAERSERRLDDHERE